MYQSANDQNNNFIYLYAVSKTPRRLMQLRYHSSYDQSNKKNMLKLIKLTFLPLCVHAHAWPWSSAGWTNHFHFSPGTSKSAIHLQLKCWWRTNGQCGPSWGWPWCLSWSAPARPTPGTSRVTSSGAFCDGTCPWASCGPMPSWYSPFCSCSRFSSSSSST